MARLIDADALIDEIKHTLWDWDSVDGIKSRTVLKQTISDINNMPTIDAEPVIRCKDCAFYWYQKLKRDGSPDKRYNPSHCYYWGKGRSPNEYCSRAMDRVSLKNAIEEMIGENKRRLR